MVSSGSAGAWNPLDRGRVARIRAFEVAQPNATAPIVTPHLELLVDVQALVLNATARCLERPQTGDRTTPVFFLAHTALDDLRQAELNLALGYIVAVAAALRDAIEAAALCCLLSAAPARADAYWKGAEFNPGTVRRALANLGMRAGIVGQAWFQYEFLSQFAHPNVERLAYVLDEIDTGSGVERTFRVGGTNDSRRLRIFGDLSVVASLAIVILVTDALERHLNDDDRARLRDAGKVVVAKARPLLLDAIKRAQEKPRPSGDSDYYARVQRRFQKIMEFAETDPLMRDSET